jgi:hypothetical protein
MWTWKQFYFDCAELIFAMITPPAIATGWFKAFFDYCPPEPHFRIEWVSWTNVPGSNKYVGHPAYGYWRRVLQERIGL